MHATASNAALHKAFQDWVLSSGLGYLCADGKLWFYRNGGDSLWDAFCAGVQLAKSI